MIDITFLHKYACIVTFLKGMKSCKLANKIYYIFLKKMGYPQPLHQYDAYGFILLTYLEFKLEIQTKLYVVSILIY
jgi:hypothetical protein